MVQEDTALTIKTVCLAVVAAVSGATGFNLAQWDLVLGVAFKGLGCISTILIIIINWGSLVEKLKNSTLFKKKEK